MLRSQAKMQKELDEMSAEFGERALGRQWADTMARPVSMLDDDDDDDVDGGLTGVV